MQARVFADAVVELNTQAGALVALIRSVAPRGRTGDLVQSIRTEQGKRPTVVRVVAGGALTTAQAGASQPYDYSRAVEFGTEHTPAQPFFFPTYRLTRKRMVSAMR